ncbi:MAG: hypothetical protein NT146_13170 [Mycobacterium sp.]|nr:hypothetical protein [Mycobacterium sp.]
MNRSRRRAAVISWVITAGVLYGGMGLGVGPIGVAPAAADPTTTEPSGGTNDGSRARTTGNTAAGSPRVGRQALGVAAADAAPHRRYPRRGAGRVLPGGVPAEGTEPAEWPWPCHIIWRVWPVVPVPDAGARSNSIIFVLASPGPPVPPRAVLSGAVDPASLELRIARRLGRARDVSNSGPPPPAVAEPPRFDRSTTPAAVIPLAGPAPPAAPPRTEAGGGSPEAGPAGYPESLRDADFAEVAVVALPGLAGILGITALGGFLGYRQAKVGYILRAAGSARFLQ